MRNSSSPPATPARKLVHCWQAYNQRRRQLEKDVLAVDERAPFVCECTSDECHDVLELTMFEFEQAHMCPNWCAVRPGHILPDDGGRVVVRQSHYWVVELSPLPAHAVCVRFSPAVLHGR
jgi:hypothetical protein